MDTANEIISRSWVIVKRDGREEPFDAGKIRRAVDKCFQNSLGLSPEESQLSARRITVRVINFLFCQGQTKPSVEEVQRAVIHQLWADGQADAAEHYTLYREEHRKLREQHPASAEDMARVSEDARHFPTPIQYYQFVSKFARWNRQAGRRETWREACNRVMSWFRSLPKVQLRDDEWQELDASLYGMETSCAMRVIQMAGPALDRCNVGAYNCAYLPLDRLRSFAELLYVLMAGTGCGFSVEEQYVSQLPRVKHQKVPQVKHTRPVKDSTEGWCDAFLFGLERWFDGEDVWFDVSQVRKRGAILETKGGRASGPESLLLLLSFARRLIKSRQGKVLSDLDCHDLACMTGKIVQVGGVRRAATISFSDLQSQAMRDCKSGNWYTLAVHRTMANNSAVYEGRPDIDTFLAEFSALVKSRAGERGIFNLKATLDQMPLRRQKRFDIRGNPCGEIQLRPFQFCNLSIVVARPWDTRETLRKKVRLAACWGCLQKTATQFQYLNPLWKQNSEEEALLGVDITGHADCPLLRPGVPGRDELLRELAGIVSEVDLELSGRFGVNPSAANTCVKPSGDSAVFFNCASGCSPWFADHIMRWVREPQTSPVARFLRDEGVPCAVAPEDPSLMVFGFPRQAPAGALTRHQMTALDQLDNWLEWKQCWAEHSVSCTVYVDEAEWPDVMAWCWKHFDLISGLSFLPRDNGVYAYAPNEELTREQYQGWLETFPEIHWEKLRRYEQEDSTESSTTYACTAGGCTT